MAKLVQDWPYLKIERRRNRLDQMVVYYYVRRKGKRTRIKGTPGTSAFRAAYEAALLDHAPNGPRPGSWNDLINRFLDAPEYRQLADGTRSNYLSHIEILRGVKPGLRHGIGDQLVLNFKRRHAKAIRDRFAETPRKANHMLQTVSRLLSYAVDLEWIVTNPAHGVPHLKTGEGYRPWNDVELLRFRKRWPIGTWERMAFELLLGTGQRGQDVREMMRTHVDLIAGTIRVKQSKTGARLILPIIGDLRQALVIWLPELPKSTTVLLPSTSTNGAMRADSFRHRMTRAIRQADLPKDCKAHGLRHTAATRLREAGLDLRTIAAVTGHSQASMVEHYSRQFREAEAAIALIDDDRTTIQENGKGT